MIIREIPLQPNSQTLTISIGGTTYILTVMWRGTGYILDIFDSAQNPIATGISLVTGADLLAQLDYLGISGKWIIVTDINPSDVPTYTSLGQTSHLYVVT